MTGLSFSKPVENATLRVASFGGGLNSTAMLFAAAHGLIEGPMPDVAIWADTQAEGDEITEHVRWMQGGNVLPFPLEIVTAGDLMARTRDAAAKTARNSVPFFVNGSGSRKEAQLNRGCTQDFKIRPVERRIREILGVKPGRRVPKGVMVEEWIGIGAEEIFRATPATRPWITNRWPLIELGWHRRHCESFLRSHELPVPPKSRCVICPYTSDERWAAIKAAGGEPWRIALETDAAIRQGFLGSKSPGAYIHRSLKPLDQVEFTSSTSDLLEHECRGRCGT